MRRWFRRFAEDGPSQTGEWVLLLLLLPFSWLYSGLQLLRATAYRCGLLRSYRAPVPVIAVGNLTVGGTGKTPVVDYLLKQLLARGERPVVVSRGYGGRNRAAVAVVSRGTGTPPLLDAAVCGDEPYLLAQRNPQTGVVIAPQRRLGVALAVQELHASVVVLDDAFSHLAVARDLNLVLLDARRPFGNGHLLPAGLLREPRSALQRGDLFLLTRATDTTVAPILPGPALRCRHLPAATVVNLVGDTQQRSQLSGLRLVAFAGIAAPEAFFTQLRTLGLDLVATLPLDDHIVYDEQTITQLNALGATADFFVTTEKDGVKLRAEQLCRPCWQIALELEFEPPATLTTALDFMLSKHKDTE